MNYRQHIKEASRKLLRKSQITPHFKSIIFEPRGDGRSFSMSYFVPELNENVQFGILSVDKSFMDFLRSQFAPKDAWDPQSAFWYLREGVLTISDKVPQRVYEQISQNLKVLMSGDKQKINNLIMTGDTRLELPVVPDTSHRMRNSAYNQLIDAYKKYTQQGAGRSSEAIPHLASLKISFRDDRRGK
jgi:hypothetical protein